MSPPLVVVTGATGFLGRALVARLRADGVPVRGTTRQARAGEDALVATGSIDGSTDWRRAVEGAAVVVHLAARAHVLRDDARTAAAAFRAANVDASVGLARAATAAGVRQLIFASSIGALAGAADAPLAENAPPNPVTPYGRSKLEAESALSAALAGSGTALAVLRMPLVLGAGAPGNLRLLERAVRRGVPLPLASVRNRRSYLFVEDFVEGVVRFIAAGAAGTYHVAHPEPSSTPQLVRALAAALGRPARLLPCPPVALRAAGRLLGREAALRGLTESLIMDVGRLQRDLGWTPALDLDRGMRLAFSGR